MSVYRPTGSSYYVFDFRRGGRRFLGTTGEQTKKQALIVQAQEIEKAETLIRHERETRRKPMVVDHAFGRYWNEIGQFAASASDIEFSLAFALEQLGKSKRLDEINDDDISKMVGVRRGHVTEAGKTDNGAQLWKPIENATINRTTQIIRRVFVRAIDNWKALIPEPPNWPKHMLPEPEERVREARFEEEDSLFEAMRDDFLALMEFASVTGLRQKAALLTWPQVDWENRQIRYQKKRRRAGEGVIWRTIPITPGIEAILRPLIGHHPVSVFTYVAERTRNGRIKGQRYPITVNGLKTRWRRDRVDSGVIDFHWHDWRHTAGSRTLRASKNLRVVQTLLGHERIESTLKYTHVLDEDVANAIESTATDVARRRDSRGKSRGKTATGSEG